MSRQHLYPNGSNINNISRIDAEHAKEKPLHLCVSARNQECFHLLLIYNLVALIYRAHFMRQCRSGDPAVKSSQNTSMSWLVKRSPSVIHRPEVEPPTSCRAYFIHQCGSGEPAAKSCQNTSMSWLVKRSPSVIHRPEVEPPTLCRVHFMHQSR